MKGEAFHRWRAELTRHLSISNDEDFLSLIFAHNALQQGDIQTASLVFGKGLLREFSGIPFHDPKRLYEWELETLVNEYLTTNGSFKWIYANSPRLNCRSSSALAFIVAILRKFENEEFGHLGHNIRYELRRIINRQFEWQRGFFNKARAIAIR